MHDLSPILNLEEERILSQLSKIGQLERILNHPSCSEVRLNALLKTLIPVDRFYREIGGIQGYQEKVKKLLNSKEPQSGKSISFHPPSFIDISKHNSFVEKTIDWGIESLPYLGEIIPLGGAADRLHLVDPKTGRELPAALLKFVGKTLLERIVDDLIAQENLYFQKFGKKITIPLALMTSSEKENHKHVEKMLRDSSWFGRPKESIRIFTQPLVPVVDKNGNWVMTYDLKLVMKPGGHGVIWKQAEDAGIFSWLQGLGKTKLLVRQINNPIAGLDYGLLSFLGIGWRENKKFGFASCPRLVKAAEGVNVIIEKDSKIALTNIEYCDFERYGIEDLPLKEGEPYSRFSSNTNLLFGDLGAIRSVIKKNPFPGLLLNLKKGSFLESNGEKQSALIGRLESTMQNIADSFTEKKGETLIPKDTYITYNYRHKTISTTKRAYVEGGTLQETPEACFYDMQLAARELLEDYCGFHLPKKRSLEEALRIGPEFVFLYHPILGPQYSVIQKKLKNGRIKEGSELSIQISDISLETLDLDGSFRVTGEASSSSILKNVRVENQGIDWHCSRPFWLGDYKAKEVVQIVLGKGSLVIIEDVFFKGSWRFVIPAGQMMRIIQRENGSLEVIDES